MASIRKFGKKSIIIILAIVLLAGAGTAYFLMHKTKAVIPASTNSSSKAKDSSSSDKNTPSGNRSTAQPSPPKNTPPSSAVLKAPFGTFVSNHHPSLSGTTSPSTEESTCNTTPGATCYIEFTKESTVKQLPAATADSSGAVSWNWDVKQAGLTVGTWQIKAIASLNGQTKSAQDSLALEVQP